MERVFFEDLCSSRWRRPFAAAKHDGDLDLVAGLEEPLDVALLGGVVMRVDLRAELDLLDDRVDLVLAGFPLLDGCLVLELAEVHELGDRRFCHRGYLDQVEVRLSGQSQRILDAHDADLFTIGANQPHFRDPETVVDTRFADVVLLSLSIKGDHRQTRNSSSPPWCARSCQDERASNQTAGYGGWQAPVIRCTSAAAHHEVRRLSRADLEPGGSDCSELRACRRGWKRLAVGFSCTLCHSGSWRQPCRHNWSIRK